MFGPWTDLYALGVTARSMIGPGAPPGPLGAWIDRMEAREPSQRFPTAAHAKAALLEPSLVHAFGASIVVGAFARGASAPSFATGSTLGGWTGQSAAGEGAPSRVEIDAPPQAPAVAPPVTAARLELPEVWPSPAPRQIWLDGAGLGLYGLRAIPLVGRSREQSALWEELLEAQRSGGPRAVVLQGSAGVGKSALAQWLGRAAMESGAPAAVTATFRPGERAEVALAAALERSLRATGLERDELEAHLRRHLGDVDEIDLDGLASAIRPPPGARRAELSSLYAQLLAALSQSGVAVVVLDDVQASERLAEDVFRGLLFTFRARLHARAGRTGDARDDLRRAERFAPGLGLPEQIRQKIWRAEVEVLGGDLAAATDAARGARALIERLGIPPDAELSVVLDALEAEIRAAR